MIDMRSMIRLLDCMIRLLKFNLHDLLAQAQGELGECLCLSLSVLKINIVNVWLS